MLSYFSSLLLWFVRLLMSIANDVDFTVAIECDQTFRVYGVDNFDSCVTSPCARFHLLHLILKLQNLLTLLAKLGFPFLDRIALLIKLGLPFHLVNSGGYFHILRILHLCLSSSALRASLQEMSSNSIGSWTQTIHPNPSQHSNDCIVENLLLMLTEVLKAAAIWGSRSIMRLRLSAISSLRFWMKSFTKSLIGWPTIV